MNIRKIVALAIGISVSGSLLAETEDIGHKTWIREVAPSNAGMEVIQPFVTVNAVKTIVGLRFDIYPVASTVKLFSSTNHSFTLSAFTGCTKPAEVGFSNMRLTEGAEAGGTNQIIGVQITRSCQTSTGWKEKHEVLLYGANISVPSGAVWFKQMPGFELWNLSIVNANTDSDFELFLTVNPDADKTNTVQQDFILNSLTGVVEVGAQQLKVESGFSG